MQPSKDARRGLAYVLIVILMVVGVQVIATAASGSSPVYVVVSKSMVPTLQVGDLVLARSIPFDSIHVGQIIIYQRPTPEGTCPNPGGEIIVHRVVGITTTGGLITQGDDRDTNPIPDEPYGWPPLPASCVKGVVFLAIPYLGLISMTIVYPYNYVLIAAILLFVFLSEVLRVHRTRPREDSSSAQEKNDT
jgi:signal peptidase